jgi:drug/metabolite transporter (DMT)-like permease
VPIGSGGRTVLPSDTAVALLALCTAVLTAAGIFFQKLNGMREGGALVSWWLALSVACFFPTFVIANKVFLMGGKMSLFVPLTATTYVLSMLVGRFYFGESVSVVRWIGCGLILVGIGAIARG